MKRYITVIILITLFISNVSAETSFKVSAPQRVTVGSQFYVTFTLNDGEGSNLKVSAVDGCKLLYGPSVSRSQSYEIVNGRTFSNSKVEYTYVYRAEKEGEYRIGEGSISVNGKTFTTTAKKITIVAGTSGTSSSTNSQSPVNMDDIDTQSSDRAVSSNDVFVRIIMNRKTAYEQEAIECTIKLYTKYSISSFIPTKQPSFDGFLIQELDLQPSLNEVESYNGQNYMTAVLKRCIMFPQKSGKLTINSGNYDISVVQYDNVNMGFFNVRTPQERKIKVSSNSASIDIKPLPSPQPEGFTGAVGQFNVESRLVGNSFRTNEPATLIYTISGTGNIKYIKEPSIDFPEEFEQYTPNSDIKADVRGSDVTGTMTIEYTFVPQSVGKFHIGSDNFVYFDPSKNEYVSIKTPVYDINVAKGAGSSESVDKKDITIKNKDILHIKTEPDYAFKEGFVVDYFWYWLIYIVFVLSLIVTLIIRHQNIKLSKDIEGSKLLRANKVAKKRLAVAKKYAEAKEEANFYDATLKAVWGYLGDKLRIPASSLSRDNIAQELQKYGASEDLTNKIINLLDQCEMARYSPADMRPGLTDIYNEASDIINDMENLKIKRI